jgi:hypothetical protein
MAITPIDLNDGSDSAQVRPKDVVGCRGPRLCRAYDNPDPAPSNSYGTVTYYAGKELAMGRRLAIIVSNINSAIDGARDALQECWRMLMAVDRKVYRPEAYYMRGPGPKWREKHAHDRDAHFR